MSWELALQILLLIGGGALILALTAIMLMRWLWRFTREIAEEDE